MSGDIELAKGIFLYETPGHTVGHYSLLLKPDGGSAKPLLFAVDVAYTAAALEKGIQPGFHNNPHDGVLSIRRVKELAAEHGAEIFYSHDMDAWHDLPPRPRLLRDLEGPEMKLQDRVAIVTGSAQGIGRAVAQKLTDEGAKVVLADINGPGVEAAAAELPGAVGLTVDVSERRRRAAHGRRDRLRATARSTCSSTSPRSCRSRPGTTSRSRSGAGSCRSTSTACS